MDDKTKGPAGQSGPYQDIFASEILGQAEGCTQAEPDCGGPGLSERAKQCRVLLAALRRGPVSTLAARSLGLMSPASRVLDLKKRGHVIETEMVTVFDAEGRPHRSGVYTLCQGAHHE